MPSRNNSEFKFLFSSSIYLQCDGSRHWTVCIKRRICSDVTWILLICRSKQDHVDIFHVLQLRFHSANGRGVSLQTLLTDKPSLAWKAEDWKRRPRRALLRSKRPTQKPSSTNPQCYRTSSSHQNQKFRNSQQVNLQDYSAVDHPIISYSTDDLITWTNSLILFTSSPKVSTHHLTSNIWTLIKNVNTYINVKTHFIISLIRETNILCIILLLLLFSFWSTNQ